MFSMVSELAFLGFLLSFLGDPRIWIAVSVILFAIRIICRRKKIDKFLWAKGFIIFVGISMSLAFLSSYVLKDIFNVPRPCSVNPSDSNFSEYCLTDPSFPSGHTTTGFAVATGLFLVFRKRLKSKSIFFFLVGILPAIGRVLQGVHTFADVTGGAVLGILFSFVFYLILTTIFKNLKK